MSTPAERLLQKLTLKQLKPLCMRLNVARSGRKQEIINRLIAACPNQRNLLQLASAQLATPNSVYQPPAGANYDCIPVQAMDTSSSVGGAMCYCRREMPHEPVSQCVQCRTWEHRSCIGRQIPRTDGYVCAKCVAMKSSVFARIHQLPVMGPFQVPTKSQQNHIGNLLAVGPTWKPILRFVRLDMQKGCWQIHHPYQAQIWVNGRNVQAPEHKEANINRQYRKTDHVPVDLSSAVGDSQSVAVQIEHQDWELCLGFVLYAEMADSKQLSFKIQKESTLPEEQCRDMVRQSFGDDTDLMETAQRVSLRCILTRTKIRVPARGSSCSHLQCFDLENFLSANQWLRVSKCPLCNRTIDLNSLQVDGYVSLIIQELAAKGLDFDDVDFDSTSAWCNPADKVKAVELLSDEEQPQPAQQGSEQAPIELSDSDDEPTTLPPPAVVYPSVLNGCAPAAPVGVVKRENERSGITGNSNAASQHGISSVIPTLAMAPMTNADVSAANVRLEPGTFQENAYVGSVSGAASGVVNSAYHDSEIHLDTEDLSQFLSYLNSRDEGSDNHTMANDGHHLMSISDELYGDL